MELTADLEKKLKIVGSEMKHEDINTTKYLYSNTIDSKIIKEILPQYNFTSWKVSGENYFISTAFDLLSRPRGSKLYINVISQQLYEASVSWWSKVKGLSLIFYGFKSELLLSAFDSGKKKIGSTEKSLNWKPTIRYEAWGF